MASTTGARWKELERAMAERKRTEELREREKRFRSLTQNASDIVTILDAEGTIHYKSPAVERILGYHEEEMVGTIAFDYVHPEDVEHVRRTFAATVESPGIHRRRGRTSLPASGGVQPGLFRGADRLLTWVVLYPDGENRAEIVTAGERTTVADIELGDLLSMLIARSSYADRRSEKDHIASRGALASGTDCRAPPGSGGASRIRADGRPKPYKE